MIAFLTGTVLEVRLCVRRGRCCGNLKEKLRVDLRDPHRRENYVGNQIVTYIHTEAPPRNYPTTYKLVKVKL